MYRQQALCALNSNYFCTFAAEMKRTLLSARNIVALCAVCLMALLSWQSHGEAANCKASTRLAPSSVLSPQQQKKQEATLTDASQNFRICNSRSQRFQPTNGEKPEREPAPFSRYAIQQHRVRILYSYHDSRCRQETAPFCMSASCDYYVIALRHLLC